MTAKILVAPMTGLARDSVTLPAAVTVAKGFQAHVDAVFARLSANEAVPLVGEGMSSAVVEQLMTSAEEEWSARAETARRTFEEVVQATGVARHDEPPGPGVASIQFREAVGREEDVITRACYLGDMLVLGRPETPSEDLQFTLSLEAALMNGGRPLLLVPPGPTPATIGRRVVVAWRGSVDCARAVAGALPFLTRADHVVVATAASSHTDTARAAELVSYLAWHVVPSQPRLVDPGHDSVGAALLNAAAAEGADLLVMGGYGHSRFRELILGGVTRHVLNNAGIPVLMAH
jgi:nucleotide-binding universal stress UspA family protein